MQLSPGIGLLLDTPSHVLRVLIYLSPQMFTDAIDDYYVFYMFNVCFVLNYMLYMHFLSYKTLTFLRMPNMLIDTQDIFCNLTGYSFTWQMFRVNLKEIDKQSSLYILISTQESSAGILGT